MKNNDYIKIDREIVKKMSEDIQAYLVENNLERVKTWKMMPFLIEKGYFPHDRKKGYPLRQVLNDLNKSNELHLIPQAAPEFLEVENKKTSIYWYFSPVK
ncbi:hypothetical protein SAMN05443634_1129 [Chishuiella changwenlii]|jgi:hypothetical protein|uniref:Uncharacterized protein n=1 Tax=Chishuiella changwenlii TaxID=1434701 RepID=A0A1M7BX79_9FLAO|nr:hypothetical protein [Chishuiella changwenlii]GGE91422.1 hypothetical protein GCM10010984_06460 [Chishuiella changwenlii]SHL59591.1 hypothetical protein SAMN05443634_1129 [Chishuiella changwenlii]